MRRAEFLSAMTVGGLAAFGQAVTPPKTHLKIGDTAPDFTLPSTAGPFKLADYIGKKTIVVAFFPMAFTGG